MANTPVQGADRMPIVVETSETAAKRLDSLLLSMEEQDTQAAARELQRLYLSHRSQLIPVATDHYLRGDVASASVFSRLPADAQVEVSNLVGTLELGNQLYKNLEFTGSDNNTEQWLSQADEQWRRGNIEKAIRIWQRLKSDTFGDNPDQGFRWHMRITDEDIEDEILKRQIVSDLTTRNFLSAERLLKKYRVKYPGYRGTVLGYEGEIADVLEEQFWKLRNDQHRSFLTKNQQFPASEAVRIDLVRAGWQVSATAMSGVGVSGNTVLVTDRSGTRALDLRTGFSRWPAGEDDTGNLLQQDSFNEEIEAGATSGVLLNNHWIAAHADRRVYAFDLKAEGRLAWFFPKRQEEKSGEWRVSGPPIRDGDDIILALRSITTEQQIRIVQLDGLTGKAKWSRVIGVPLNPLPMKTWQDQLCTAVDEIFVNLSGKSVVALEAESGAVRWIRGFSSTQQEIGARAAGIQYARGRLFTLNHKTVTALDPDTGSVHWQTQLPDDVQLSGLCDLSLILSGQQLWSLDRDTGKIQWRCELDQTTSYSGHAKLVGGNVLWVKGQQFLTVNAQNGRVLQRDTLPCIRQPASIQHFSNHHLLIAPPTQVVFVEIIRSK